MEAVSAGGGRAVLSLMRSQPTDFKSLPHTCVCWGQSDNRSSYADAIFKIRWQLKSLKPLQDTDCTFQSQTLLNTKQGQCSYDDNMFGAQFCCCTSQTKGSCLIIRLGLDSHGREESVSASWAYQSLIFLRKWVCTKILKWMGKKM